MEQDFAFADRLGPEKIVHIWEPRLGLKAIVVIDNVAGAGHRRHPHGAGRDHRRSASAWRAP